MVVVTTDREVIVAGHKIGRAKTHTQLGRQVTLSLRVLFPPDICLLRAPALTAGTAGMRRWG